MHCTSWTRCAFNITAANAAPMIEAIASLSRQQGAAVSNFTIANVTDDGSSGAVTVAGLVHCWGSEGWGTKRPEAS